MKRRFPFKRRFRNKFNNSSCTCQKGHKHDSRGEAGYCDELRLLEKAGKIQEYETQKTFEIHVEGKKICAHRVDFYVTEKDGRKTVHEYKGI